MTIVDDTNAYEKWLATQCKVVGDGLDDKHKRMAKEPFKFFRATCYRYARKLADWLPDLVRSVEDPALQVPSIGDAHIENWGTWRDDEGRLVWGVNDFDEAAMLPYIHDLIRLATSAELAPDLPGDAESRARAILAGYRRGLKAPAPFFANDSVPWFSDLLADNRPKRNKFADELAEAEAAKPPAEVRAILEAQLPAGTRNPDFRTWQKGGGSLGRPRYIAIGTWRGGQVVREAKALVPSAWDWAAGRTGNVGLFVIMATGPYRSPDPFLAVQSGYIVRRIAADSQKISLGAGDAKSFNAELLEAMGADIAATHLSDRASATKILADLDRQGPSKWLAATAETVAGEVADDFAVWEAHYADTPSTVPKKRK
jgi:hypothetical protein